MNLYLNKRFYICLGAIIAIFLLAFSFPIMMMIGWWTVGLFVVLIITEYIILWQVSNHIIADRVVSPKLSLGDKQNINYSIKNDGKVAINYD